MSDTIIEIDKNNLDEEWLQQPVKYQEASEKLAHLRSVTEAKKLMLEIAYSQLQKAVREDPEYYGISGKPTEATVEAAIKRTRKWMDAQTHYLSAKLDQSVQNAVVEALDHRKSALEQLCYLHSQSYFQRKVKRPEGDDTSILAKIVTGKHR